VAPSSATQLKLKLRVDSDDAIVELIADSPGSEIRLPPSAKVCNFFEVLVASCNPSYQISDLVPKYDIRNTHTHRNRRCATVSDMIVSYVEMHEVGERLEDVGQRNYSTVAKVVVGNINASNGDEMPPEDGVN